MRLLAAGLLALAVAGAQELTPRQLFYQEEAPKPAPKAAPKTAPKKAAPPKTAKQETPKKPAQTQPAAQPDIRAGGAEVTQPERPTVINAAYNDSQRPLGLRYALVQIVNGAEQEVSPTATFR